MVGGPGLRVWSEWTHCSAGWWGDPGSGSGRGGPTAPLDGGGTRAQGLVGVDPLLRWMVGGPGLRVWLEWTHCSTGWWGDPGSGSGRGGPTAPLDGGGPGLRVWSEWTHCSAGWWGGGPGSGSGRSGPTAPLDGGGGQGLGSGRSGPTAPLDGGGTQAQGLVGVDPLLRWMVGDLGSGSGRSGPTAPLDGGGAKA